MTNRNYTTQRSYNHSTFGGIISNFDFDGHPTMKTIADSIEFDLNFDKQCKKNAENRDRQMNYKRSNNVS